MTDTRFHGLDACRATMMGLGIAVHGAITYATFTGQLTALPPDDPQFMYWHFVDGNTSWVADLTFVFLHNFRMQVFFILAGFFAALLASKYGAQGFLRNRIMRIALPLFVVWATLMPAERLTALFANWLAGGREEFMEKIAWRGYFDEVWNITGAFWFLYYLLVLCLIAYAALRLLAHTDLAKKYHRTWEQLNTHPLLRVSILSVVTFLLIGFYAQPFLPVDQDFIPDPRLLGMYGLFFMAGWSFFRVQTHLDHLTLRCWRYVGSGFLTFIAWAAAISFWTQEASKPLLMLTWLFKACTMWLFSFGIIGLFLRFASGGKAYWRYISDGSYFVYIIHVHVFLLVQAGLSFTGIPVPFKLLITVVVSFGICLGLYEVLARHTWVSVFLNGRKYPLKSSVGSSKVNRV